MQPRILGTLLKPKHPEVGPKSKEINPQPQQKEHKI
jgi:hypothetical protein